MTASSTWNPRSRRVVVVVIVGVFVAGVIVGGLAEHHGPATPRPAGRPGSAATLGPRGTADGVRAGFGHSRPGALAAAIGYVGLGQTMYDLTPEARDQALRRIAAHPDGDAFVAREATLFARLHDQSQGRGFSWRLAVIATRVDAYAPARARVSLWRVGVASAGDATPVEEWVTVSYDLAWQDRDWKVRSETDGPGPTPSANSAAAVSSAQELASSLAGFSAFPSGTR